jgi:mono/diheme cytochrome c family protein
MAAWFLQKSVVLRTDSSRTIAFFAGLVFLLAGVGGPGNPAGAHSSLDPSGALSAAPYEAPSGNRLRGEYWLRAGGCVSCHTQPGGAFLAGGRVIDSPFGRFLGPNITPDPVYGIGQWEFDDFERAMRFGERPDGQHYYPAFPYISYTQMHLEDLRDLWEYLRSVEPVAQEVPGHDLVWFVRWRPLLQAWKFLHFRPAAFTPQADATAEWNRGAYLVRALGHCAECHSPRTRTGAVLPNLRYAGGRLGSGEYAPNITPDRTSGIGGWRPAQILRYLDMGMTPTGDFAGGAMAEVIDHGTGHLTVEDRRAVVTYLLALPPIQHPADRVR